MVAEPLASANEADPAVSGVLHIWLVVLAGLLTSSYRVFVCIVAPMRWSVRHKRRGTHFLPGGRHGYALAPQMNSEELIMRYYACDLDFVTWNSKTRKLPLVVMVSILRSASTSPRYSTAKYPTRARSRVSLLARPHACTEPVPVSTSSRERIQGQVSERLSSHRCAMYASVAHWMVDLTIRLSKTSAMLGYAIDWTVVCGIVSRRQVQDNATTYDD